MHAISARLLGIILLLLAIAAPVASPMLLGYGSPADTLAQDGSPVAEATTSETGEIEPAIPTDIPPESTEPTELPTETPTEIVVAPAETVPDSELHTISAVIDDPTTCVAGRSWWFSISNPIAQEKNPAEITVTFVGQAGIAVPLDSPGSGGAFEAIYILSGNLDATLESATAQVDSTVEFTFLLVKGPHCPGIPDEVASFTPTSTPTNTPTETGTPTVTPTITQTPRPTKQITAQLDDPKECGVQVGDWGFSIANPVSFELNPGFIDVSFTGGDSVRVDVGAGRAIDHNAYTNFYVVKSHLDEPPLSAVAIVDAAVEHTFKLIEGPKCTVRTPTPSNTPTITLTPTLTLTSTITPSSTLTSTPTFTATVPPGTQYIFATLSDTRPCQISSVRWRFAIVTELTERANPASIEVTFRDGTVITVPRSETVREDNHALVSYYDSDQKLNGTVASAKAVVSTDGQHLFVLLEGTTCFGSPTPTVTSTPDQSCGTQIGRETRICATIDLKSCKQSQNWVFTIAPQFFEPQFPSSIVVNFPDGRSYTVSPWGPYRDGDRIWQDYPVFPGRTLLPGAAWASVPTSLNTAFGYVFQLKSGPGCHRLGEGESSTATPSPTLAPRAPSPTPFSTHTPSSTDPSAPLRTPTPPIGVLPATGAGDADTNPGVMTLLAFAAILGLGLAIRRRSVRA